MSRVRVALGAGNPGADMTVDAVIFDVDGTLIDSNALHVEGWRRAFEKHGYKVLTDRIELEVGKGGDQLVPAILGEAADKKDGESLRKMAPEEYVALARSTRIKVFDGAREVIAALKKRGIRTAVATSSNEQHLRATQESCGVDWKKAVDVFVGADDAERTKPHPDLVVAATEKLGMTPAQCAMVGDTIYDGEAAHRAGVAFIGVLTGFGTERGLRRAGARIVLKDVAQMHARLDEVLHESSQVRVKLDGKMLEKLMREALAIAEEGLKQGQLPIGCVLAAGDGSILARAHNAVDAQGDVTAHAEMEAFRKARGKLDRTASDLIMVSTLEPCVMCTGAAMQGSVDVVLYGLQAPADSGTRRVQCPETPEGRMPRVVGSILADESRALLTRWLQQHASSPSSAYVKQLLALERKSA